MTIRLIAGIVAALMLAACGNGGGGGVAAPPADPEPVSDAETRDALESRIERAGVTITDAYPLTERWGFGVEERLSFTLDELRHLDLRPRDPAFQGLGTRRGVTLAFAEDLRPGEAYFDYAGWLEHSVFLIHGWHKQDSDDWDPQVFSIGPASGTNPVSGGAVWTGVMAGIDEGQRDSVGNLVEGNAEVRLDFAVPEIDVRLTGIRDRVTGAAYDDMAWLGLRIEFGVFDGPGILGRFYGPSHEEVGGVFVENGIAGAFGATRE